MSPKRLQKLKDQRNLPRKHRQKEFASLNRHMMSVAVLLLYVITEKLPGPEEVGFQESTKIENFVLKFAL